MSKAKESILEFMKSHPSGSRRLIEIESIKLQDWDGEDGFIGENYVVTYIAERYDPQYGPTEEKGTAYVNVDSYKRWKEDRNPVRYE